GAAYYGLSGGGFNSCAGYAGVHSVGDWTVYLDSDRHARVGPWNDRPIWKLHRAAHASARRNGHSFGAVCGWLGHCDGYDRLLICNIVRSIYFFLYRRG